MWMREPEMRYPLGILASEEDNDENTQTDH